MIKSFNALLGSCFAKAGYDIRRTRKWTGVSTLAGVERIGVTSAATEDTLDLVRNLKVPGEVTVMRREDFCREHRIGRIDLLKTDAEGLNLGVLRGVKSLFTGGLASGVLCEVGFAAVNTGPSYFPPLAAFSASLVWRLFCIRCLSEQGHFGRWGVCHRDALYAKPPVSL